MYLICIHVHACGITCIVDLWFFWHDPGSGASKLASTSAPTVFHSSIQKQNGKLSRVICSTCADCASWIWEHSCIHPECGCGVLATLLLTSLCWNHDHCNICRIHPMVSSCSYCWHSTVMLNAGYCSLSLARLSPLSWLISTRGEHDARLVLLICDPSLPLCPYCCWLSWKSYCKLDSLTAIW